jgi:hypothetical protein
MSMVAIMARFHRFVKQPDKQVMTMHRDRPRTDPFGIDLAVIRLASAGVNAAALRAGILQRAIGQQESRNDL